MMSLIILILVIVCNCYSNELSANVITWQRIYGDSGEDVGNSVVQTFDGGYIMCGYSQLGGHTRVIRTNQFGDVIWDKTFSSRANEKVIQTKDSNFILVGFGDGLVGIYSDAYIIKINQDGNLIWWKKYGGLFGDYFHDVLLTSNDELIFLGTYSTEEFIRSMYLLKTDSS